MPVKDQSASYSVYLAAEHRANRAARWVANLVWSVT